MKRCHIARLLLLPVLASVLAVNAPPASAVTSRQHSGPAPLAQLLDEMITAGVPGAAVLVDHDGRVHATGRGVADTRTGRAMRPDLTYRVASLTKPMVATVALQLVGEGRLSLDDTIDRWLPGLLPYGHTVTVRHLLSMTSGVPEYLRGQIALDTFGPLPGRLRSWTPRQLVSLVADRPPLFAPGTGTAYSNTNYVLTGLIIETVAGSSLGDELGRRLFSPLGLRHTAFPVRDPGIAGTNARGYSLPIDPRQGPVEEAPLRDVTVLNPSFAWGAGNVTSTLRDVTRFLGALLGGELLPANLLAEMTTPALPGSGYGLGLNVIDTGCGRVIGHDGAVSGFRTMVLATPDARRGYGFTTNQYATGAAASQTFSRVVVALMQHLFPGATCDVESAQRRTDRGFGDSGPVTGDVPRHGRHHVLPIG